MWLLCVVAVRCRSALSRKRRECLACGTPLGLWSR